MKLNICFFNIEVGFGTENKSTLQMVQSKFDLKNVVEWGNINPGKVIL